MKILRECCTLDKRKDRRKYTYEKLLIVVDMQNDFVTGALGTKEAEKIVPNVKARIERAEKGRMGYLVTKDTHGEDYLKTQEGAKLPVVSSW